MPDDVAVDSVPDPGVDTPSDDATTDSGKDSYTVEEYKALQKENQKYREKWSGYEKLYSDPDAQLFHNAAQAYKSGDMDTVAQFLIRNTAALKGSDETALVDFLEGGGDPADFQSDEDEAPLTRAEVRQMLADQQAGFAQQQESAQVEEIWSAAEEISGFARGSRDWRRILDLGAHETNGDLKAALKIIDDEKQAAIDGYLAEKKAERDGTPRTTTGQAPAKKTRFSLDGSVPGTVRAADAVEAFLAERE